MSLSDKYDLLAIGGGINGAGIACAAAGRGLKALLCKATDLGKKVGHNVYDCEAHCLKVLEWAKQHDDILWRRTKAGLHLDAQGRATAKRTLEAIL